MDWLWRESWGRGALDVLQPIILSCPLQIPLQQRSDNILFWRKIIFNPLTCHEKEKGLSRLSLPRSKTAEGVSLVQVLNIFYLVINDISFWRKRRATLRRQCFVCRSLHMKSRNSTLVGFGTDDHYLDAYKRTRCLELYNFTLQQVYAWRVWVSLTRISLYNWRTGSQFISLLECPGAVRVLSCVGWHMIIRQGGWKNRTLMVGIDIYSIFLPKDHCVLALGPQEDEGSAPSLFKTLQQDNRGGRFNSTRLSHYQCL